MTDDTKPKKNTIVTEEMAEAARARLKAWFAQQQAEREVEPTNELAHADLSSQQAQLDFEDESDDEPRDEDAHDLFPFTAEEGLLIDQLRKAIRRRMLNAEPQVLQKIAALLHALERLPYFTAGVALDLAMVDRVDENLSYVSVELDETSFRLSSGGSVFSPGVGSDSYSSTAFEIELGGFRNGEAEDFREWLNAFLAASGELRVEGDADVDLNDSAPDDGWDRLQNYWESQ